MEKNKYEKRNPVCDPCEMNFQKNIKGLVNNVEHHTKANHNRKEAEVHAAFDKRKR